MHLTIMLQGLNKFLTASLGAVTNKTLSLHRCGEIRGKMGGRIMRGREKVCGEKKGMVEKESVWGRR